MKAVIIGAGQVGFHIAKFLSLTHDVIVIEKDEDALRRADELDIQVMEGNGANAISSQVFFRVRIFSLRSPELMKLISSPV